MNYKQENFCTFKVDDESGDVTMLCNFVAQITHETHFVDGRSRETTLRIEGQKANSENRDKPITLPSIEINAADYASLGWVLPNWGVQAIVRPGSSVRDDLRTAIQMYSKPEILTVYKYIGWAEINGKPAYLHSEGAITAKGNDDSVEVRLPNELSKYDLTTDVEDVDGIRATLALADLTRPEVTWPLIAATILPLFGPVDFGVHVTGRTGTFKSELMSIFQSHYGEEMDARHLPGSWSSTPNALEAQAYSAANAVFVVDDFVPQGTAYQQRAYQATADKLIRAQGNQSGRARLTDTSSLQTTMYPRGIVFSTGEDTPEGHSVRARLMITELSPGEIETSKLTQAQVNRSLYTATTVAIIKQLCQTPVNLKRRAEQIRDKSVNIGHSRTPSMIGKLTAAIEWFLDFAAGKGAIDQKEKVNLTKKATEAILKAGERQIYFMEATDPVDLFLAAMRHVLNAGLGHFRSLSGGIPNGPELLGWSAENAMGEIPTYKSRGPCIGWVDWNEDQIYMDVTTGYNIVKKVGGPDISLTKQTMMKRLKDAGHLARTDENRQRNTIRITAEQHPRQVIALVLSTTLETQEVPQDDNGTKLDPDDYINNPGRNPDADDSDD